MSRSQRISAEEFEAMIWGAMDKFSDEVLEASKIAIDETAVHVAVEIKRRVTFTQRRGKYVKSFKLKNTMNDKRNYQHTWYVAHGEHRLTHLLEHGHRLVRSKAPEARTYTAAFPHIQYGAELAREMLPKEIEKQIGLIRESAAS